MNDNYPRPQLRRTQWQSLNGTWLVNGQEVVVPSCLQLQEMEYIKEFEFKRTKDRTILHFSSVDQICEVYLNDKLVGKHEGGYLPFEFEITDVVIDGNNKLVVKVTDKLDETYPYGKQTLHPSGMWYTPVTGIWGDVWLEQLPSEYIKSVKISPDLKGVDLDIEISLNKHETLNKHQRIDVDKPILWDINDPYLYTEKLNYGNDEVEIYYALRTVEIKEKKLYLNGKPLFINGVLDQGYWPNNLFIPDSEDGYQNDILNMKELGFNLLRKHIKIEPEKFYYLCDKLGMLVMQDMVQNGHYDFIKDTALPSVGFQKRNDKVKEYDKRQKFFIKHAKDTLKHLYNHPCIIAYTIFNEGWGQFDSDNIYLKLKKQDPTRLFDSTSGWFEQNESDFDSKHIYFKLRNLTVKEKPLLVSECGGFIYAVNGAKAKWGYGKANSSKQLTDLIVELYEKMIIPKIKDGLCGIIYTQVSDVQGETNGLYSFDRSICKVEKERIKEIISQTYQLINE